MHVPRVLHHNLANGAQDGLEVVLLGIPPHEDVAGGIRVRDALVSLIDGVLRGVEGDDELAQKTATPLLWLLLCVVPHVSNCAASDRDDAQLFHLLHRIVLRAAPILLSWDARLFQGQQKEHVVLAKLFPLGPNVGPDVGKIHLHAGKHLGRHGLAQLWWLHLHDTQSLVAHGHRHTSPTFEGDATVKATHRLHSPDDLGDVLPNVIRSLELIEHVVPHEVVVDGEVPQAKLGEIQRPHARLQVLRLVVLCRLVMQAAVQHGFRREHGCFADALQKGRPLAGMVQEDFHDKLVVLQPLLDVLVPLAVSARRGQNVHFSQHLDH
eukprot:scaffold748_cov251-Pinguiococcus_pyrenoidosus.AAC.9